MRRPRMQRPKANRIGKPPAHVSLDEVARRVRYVGSVEHKATASAAGLPRPRPSASICPLELDSDLGQPTMWLRAGIRAGWVSGRWEQGFPRYVWYKGPDAGTVYVARLTNAGSGLYKGWPLNPSEWPEEFRK